MNLKRDKFLVVGMSKSGLATTSFLLSNGAKCYVYDDSDSKKIADECKRLEEYGAVWINKKEVYDLLK